MIKKKRARTIAIASICVFVAALAVLLGIYLFTISYVGKEREVRTDWAFESGELIQSDTSTDIELRDASLDASIDVARLVPTDVETDDFTYYDEGVQDRLHQTLSGLRDAQGASWTAEEPLAVLNPYGTGSNGLYLAFDTEYATQVTYTVHVPGSDYEDFTATAASCTGDAFEKQHELLVIGLVPGETCELTLTMKDVWGIEHSEVTYTVCMPETQSGYGTTLEATDGESTQELSDGLYVLARTNGYLGYVFFFDNEGTMRYEMVLEGYGTDRLLEYEGDLVTSVSAEKVARIDSTGRVVQVYGLDPYAMHHDMILADDETAWILASSPDDSSVEDVVVQLDLETGEVSELVDFDTLMADYSRDIARETTALDTFYWAAGQRDWLHLNTIQYVEPDRMIVSSRETSTIIVVDNVSTDPEISAFIGDSRTWEGTPYEDLCYTQVGDFAPQYGQHSVEILNEEQMAALGYAPAGSTTSSTATTVLEQGQYLLRIYNNNYWAMSSRDYDPELDESVSRELGASDRWTSSVYYYLVDEDTEAFELVESFDVPYSSVVSNVSDTGSLGNTVSNSGVANVFGEYDATGTLIRQFAYPCEVQGYRVFKIDMTGYWFAD